MYYLKEFVLYSILGYIFEIIGAVIMHKDLNSGFMYGTIHDSLWNKYTTNIYNI